MSIDQPDYTVIFEENGIEYRHYDAYLVAETVMPETSNYSAAGSEGFRRLFRYISGANQGSRKISMTAPVEQAPAGGQAIKMTASLTQAQEAEGWSLAFMLPGQYSIETAPEPTDARVRIRAVPERTVAVLGYSGRWTEANRRAAEKKLRSALAEAEVELVGAVNSAMFNSPFMLPFLRRNEVHAPIRNLPATAPADGLVAEL